VSAIVPMSSHIRAAQHVLPDFQAITQPRDWTNQSPPTTHHLLPPFRDWYPPGGKGRFIHPQKDLRWADRHLLSLAAQHPERPPSPSSARGEARQSPNFISLCQQKSVPIVDSHLPSPAGERANRRSSPPRRPQGLAQWDDDEVRLGNRSLSGWSAMTPCGVASR
jgi:hypothetical protein